MDALLGKLGVECGAGRVLIQAQRVQGTDNSTTKADLAPGWVEKYSDMYAVPFYHNAITQQSSWSRPIVVGGQVTFVETPHKNNNNGDS